MKTKMSEVKNTVDGIIGGLDITKENIGDFESNRNYLKRKRFLKITLSLPSPNEKNI